MISPHPLAEPRDVRGRHRDDASSRFIIGQQELAHQHGVDTALSEGYDSIAGKPTIGWPRGLKLMKNSVCTAVISLILLIKRWHMIHRNNYMFAFVV
jgi:hypothetical protein